jgi:hypothetical protein
MIKITIIQLIEAIKFSARVSNFVNASTRNLRPGYISLVVSSSVGGMCCTLGGGGGAEIIIKVFI